MMDVKREVKIKCAVSGVSLADVGRAMGWDYYRIVRVVNGIAAPRPGEVLGLLGAIDRLGKARRLAMEMTAGTPRHPANPDARPRADA